MLDADLINAWDGGDWTWYIRGHDPSGDELYQIDDPESLLSEALWMCDQSGLVNVMILVLLMKIATTPY